MSRYIDADAFEVFGYDVPKEYDVESFGAGVCCVLDELDKQPTADVRENVHGEWRYGENDIGLDGYWCTACGKFVLWNYNETIDFIHRYNFCPNCGADMIGENDEKKADRPDSDQAGN